MSDDRALLLRELDQAVQEITRLRAERDSAHAAGRLEERDRQQACSGRLEVIIDEAYGMQPVRTTEDSLTFLEQMLFRDRLARERELREIRCVLYDLVQNELNWAQVVHYQPEFARRIDGLLADFVRYPNEAIRREPDDGG